MIQNKNQEQDKIIEEVLKENIYGYEDLQEDIIHISKEKLNEILQKAILSERARIEKEIDEEFEKENKKLNLKKRLDCGIHSCILRIEQELKTRLFKKEQSK